MSLAISTNKQLSAYHAWDRTVRVFHWVNVLCILGLSAVGLAILYNKSFGVSPDGKILLKNIHAYIGYVFVFNFTWRIIWGFIGNKYARWAAILPLGSCYIQSVKDYIKSTKSPEPIGYLGHNPLARIMVTMLLLLLTTQAITGLILAGTDLYLPPFGHEIAEWVTDAGEDHSKIANLTPGSTEGVVAASYQEMRDFRKPIITTHKYAFYLLMISILLHILAVVITEVREKIQLSVRCLLAIRLLIKNQSIANNRLLRLI